MWIVEIFWSKGRVGYEFCFLILYFIESENGDATWYIQSHTRVDPKTVGYSKGFHCLKWQDPKTMGGENCFTL